MSSTADRQTFDRLMLEHLSAAQRFAVRLTGDADAAEEVVQDALLRAARSWQTFRGEASFKTWLLRIVVHAAYDRRNASRKSSESLEDDPPDARGDDPADLAAAADLGTRVAWLVSNLPARQREVLVLIAYEDVSIAEAANVLAMTEQNVRTTLHLARRRLKAQLARTMDVNRGTDRR